MSQTKSVPADRSRFRIFLVIVGIIVVAALAVAAVMGSTSIKLQSASRQFDELMHSQPSLAEAQEAVRRMGVAQVHNRGPRFEELHAFLPERKFLVPLRKVLNLIDLDQLIPREQTVGRLFWLNGTFESATNFITGDWVSSASLKMGAK